MYSPSATASSSRRVYMFQTASIYNWILRSLLVISLLGCQGGTQRFSLMPEQDNIASNLEMNEEVDVLWIIDNSTSMQKHQDALAAQVSHFINAMDETKLD